MNFRGIVSFGLGRALLGRVMPFPQMLSIPLPDRLLSKPADLWAGDVELAKWFCERGFHCRQTNIPDDFWKEPQDEAAWQRYLHSFAWLRDLRAMGGEQARKAAVRLFESWLETGHLKKNRFIWAPDIMARRLCFWISHYEYFEPCLHPEVQERFFESLALQSHLLSKQTFSPIPDCQGLAKFEAIKGLIYCGLALECHERVLEKGLSLLHREFEAQILPDGVHASHSPAQSYEVLKVLIEIKNALNTAAYPVPERLQQAIEAMTLAVRFFCHNDKKFALFHGTQERTKEEIRAVLMQANVRSKSIEHLSYAGYRKMVKGRTVVMAYVGAMPKYPYEKAAHAAPLAFELSHGQHRIFTSCGTHSCCSEWAGALRTTSAHNTATLDNRNACEIGDDGHFIRKVKVVSSYAENTKEAALIDASHDGYLALNGITHRRRLFLGEDGYDFRGEESFVNTRAVSSRAGYPAIEAHVRFHMHPRIAASMSKDGQSALIRTPDGIGWRFNTTDGRLSLEESVYLGEGNVPRKTKQLVIAGQIADKYAKISWSLRREGL